MDYRKRIILLVGIDLILIWLSIYSSYVLRFREGIPEQYMEQLLIYGVVGSLITTACMMAFRLYNRVWQYASIGEMISILKAIVLATVVSYVVVYLLSGQPILIAVLLRTFETILLTIGGARFFWRIFRDGYSSAKDKGRRVLIYGAGDCGSLIAKEMRTKPALAMNPIGFIDDDPAKRRLHILGLPILGDRSVLEQIVKDHQVEDLVIAIPSASRQQISEIIEIGKKTTAKVKIIPVLNDLIQGKISVQKIRDIEVEDLLGRDPVQVDLEGIANYVENKVVLVTGAGGSIGSEICRQLVHFQPKQILLLGHGENSIYNIEMEFRRRFPQVNVHSIIADVQDRNRMEYVFEAFSPQVVFHAAAHKHVPLMEANPTEAIKNNVFGTRNVAECAHRFNVERFVLISSDKAVNPTSVMGGTKRIAEMFIQTLNAISKTKFAAVRFGNVLGSRGSVIPRFKEQIALGGPVTVTHPEMIRYFMTIPEASQLVIQAGAFATGGEVFILDMGKPVNIYQLAKDLIQMSGFEPEVDIAITFTGIRPGEKLYEELLTDEEGLTSTQHNRIFICKPSTNSTKEMELMFKSLEKIVFEDQLAVKEAVSAMVPGFMHVG